MHMLAYMFVYMHVGQGAFCRCCRRAVLLKMFVYMHVLCMCAYMHVYGAGSYLQVLQEHGVGLLQHGNQLPVVLLKQCCHLSEAPILLLLHRHIHILTPCMLPRNRCLAPLSSALTRNVILSWHQKEYLKELILLYMHAHERT